jgi:RNA-directed DNA polymerase
VDAEGWYRRRSYAHFDRPISESEASALVTSPDRVARHGFWPVILNPRRVVSLKANEDGRRVRAEKRRPIVYAAHSDAHIYAYYAHQLGQRLEDAYAQEGGDCVLAYRRFLPAKCNVHFALAAFEELSSQAPRDLVAMDVEGFFDALKHDRLKMEWQCLLDVDRLPPDHFAVFKACTRDYAIALPELRDALGGEIRRRAGRDGGAICSPLTFRECVAPRLQARYELVNKTKKKSPRESGSVGIPQGLPISAVLANVYMRGTDKAIADAMSSLGGSYRRYSDDLLLVVPAGLAAQAERIVNERLQEVGLTVNDKKTERRRVRRSGESILSLALNVDGNELGARPASYLGMSFDGALVRVRSSTITKFLVKARRAITRAKLAALDVGERRIRRRQLYARLTSIGYGQAYGEWTPGAGRPAGAPRIGFFRYLRLAERVTGSEAVSKQKRQVEQQIFRWLNEADAELQSST